MARCDSYTFGNCTWGACKWFPWIRDGWGNALDWMTHAAAQGFATSGQPMGGAVAIYLDKNQYDEIYGHCALVDSVASYSSFKVLEMNYSGFNVYDYRWSTRNGLLGFILPPGVTIPPGAPTPPPPLPQLDQLHLAWSDVQQLWNTDIETAITHIQWAGGQIKQLSQS